MFNTYETCDMRHFRFWCQKVLPLVYDDSLSYYEVLCKVVKYINNIIEEDKTIVADIAELKAELKIVQNWIDNFDTTHIEEIVNEYLGEAVKAVYFGLSSDGYFMAVYPDMWKDIKFGTIQNGDLYGHLTLEYD